MRGIDVTNSYKIMLCQKNQSVLLKKIYLKLLKNLFNLIY